MSINYRVYQSLCLKADNDEILWNVTSHSATLQKLLESLVFVSYTIMSFKVGATYTIACIGTGTAADISQLDSKVRASCVLIRTILIDVACISMIESSRRSSARV